MNPLAYLRRALDRRRRWQRVQAFRNPTFPTMRAILNMISRETWSLRVSRERLRLDEKHRARMMHLARLNRKLAEGTERLRRLTGGDS